MIYADRKIEVIKQLLNIYENTVNFDEADLTQDSELVKILNEAYLLTGQANRVLITNPHPDTN